MFYYSNMTLIVITSFSASDVGDLRADYETFKTDHPFLFFIRDRTNNVIVVAGKVMDPTSDNSFFKR